MSFPNPQSSRKDFTPSMDIKRQDVNNMESNLAKLRGLSEDDKTENAMLRSRIDEQSQLIMVLKNRADDASGRLGTVQKVNQDLMAKRDDASEKINMELHNYKMLDKRFFDLAENHEEMIKIKDEYKHVNKELRAENFKLRDDNARLFSKALLEKDQQLAEIEEKYSAAKDKFDALDIKLRQMQHEFRSKETDYKQQITDLQEKYKSEFKLLQNKISDTEERLKGANYKLQCHIEGHENSSTELQTRLQQMTKEKDEMLDLAMQRGKLVQKEQSENKRLQKQVTDMEKAVRQMEEKFERDSAAVNVNLQVQRLRTHLTDAEDRYQDVMKEFDAFKKHSNNMLQREKQLNERLRHLAG